MQQELKFEAYRMESVRKSAESICFDRCVPAPANVMDVLSKLAPDRVPLVQPPMTEEELRDKFDLSPEEALCVDRCSWKYMHTGKIALNALNRAKTAKDVPGQR